MKKRDSPEPSLCGGCGSSERHLLLHYVRLRGSFQRLCTNCLLKTHAGLFCPFCLDLFNLPPPPRGTVTCATCPSVAHRSCVAAKGSSFECPPCSNSSFFFFFSGAGEFAWKKKPQQLLGKESAKAFVVAAKIAAGSMRKAAAAARSDAERRVREAVAAKKRAREALEVLAILVSKEKEEDEERGGEKEKAKKSEAMQVLANIATCMAARPSEFRSNAMEE